METRIFSFNNIIDERGGLVFLEANRSIPFDIKHIHYIHSISKETKKKYCNQNMQQCLICIAGSVKIVLDDGISNYSVELNDPSKGLHIDANINYEITYFSKDAMVLVVASNSDN